MVLEAHFPSPLGSSVGTPDSLIATLSQSEERAKGLADVCALIGNAQPRIPGVLNGGDGALPLSWSALCHTSSLLAEADLSLLETWPWCIPNIYTQSLLWNKGSSGAVCILLLVCLQTQCYLKCVML